MLNTFVKSKGVMKTITHNNNQTNTNVINMDADYDGNVANISLDTNSNGKNKHFNIQLDNNDLANILNVPSVNKPLNLRLLNDFKKNKSKKHRNHKRNPFIIEFENPYSSDSSFIDSSTSSTDSSTTDSTNLLNESSTLSDLLNSSNSSHHSHNSPNLLLDSLNTHLSSPNSQEEFIIPLTLDNKKSDFMPKKKHKTHKVYKIKKHSSSSSPKKTHPKTKKYHYSLKRKRVYE